MAAPPRPDCDDRVHHNVNGPCAVRRVPCNKGHGGGRYTVCDDCHQRTQRDLDIHANGAKFRILGGQPSAYSPPMIWHGQPNKFRRSKKPPWEGFLTRACENCQKQLQEHRAAIVAGNISLPQEATRWQSTAGRYFCTCTCRYTLGMKAGGPTLCFGHREKLFEALVKRKNKNDFWLRNTEVDDRGRTSQASDATKRARRTDDAARATRTTRKVTGNVTRNVLGTWRSCRCGDDPDSSLDCEVWICMACEGFYSRVTPAASRHVLAVPHRMHTRPREQYPLGRVRDDFTQ